MKTQILDIKFVRNKNRLAITIDEHIDITFFAEHSGSISQAMSGH